MTKTKATRANPPATRRTVRRPAAGRARKTASAGSAPRAQTTVRRRRAPRMPKAVATAVRAALDKKAEDVIVLDLRQAGGFTDYFVICTGANARHIGAIADAVHDAMAHDFGERPALTEGADRSEWVLLDYFDFVVHIFSRECRAFYGLERLWGNAVRHEMQEEGDRRKEEGDSR